MDPVTRRIDFTRCLRKLLAFATLTKVMVSLDDVTREEAVLSLFHPLEPAREGGPTGWVYLPPEHPEYTLLAEFWRTLDPRTTAMGERFSFGGADSPAAAQGE